MWVLYYYIAIMLANTDKMSLPTDTGVFCDHREPLPLQ